PLLLQPLHAPLAGRRRQADPVGQVDNRQPPLRLQRRDDLPVDFIEGRHFPSKLSGSWSLPPKIGCQTNDFAGIPSGVQTHTLAMDTFIPVAGLRGDYTFMAPDWTVRQPDDYSAEDQAVWRLLVERQTKLAKQFACAEFLQGLAALSIGDGIPD